jgi:tetratricopeptide (TPR) repeat protein
MLELIIIISLAIIFFIFLYRMPEVEKIGQKRVGDNKKTRAPFFQKELEKFFTFFSRLREKKKAQPEVFKEEKLESNFKPEELFSAAERKLRFRDFNGAEKIYLKLATLYPNESTVYGALGKIYFERKNYEDAVASFKAALKRDRMNGFYYYDLALALFRLRRYEEANICFEKSIEINNRIPIRHLGLGISLLKIHEYERAVKSFKRALEIEPNNEKYRRLLDKAQRQSRPRILNSNQ